MQPNGSARRRRMSRGVPSTCLYCRRPFTPRYANAGAFCRREHYLAWHRDRSTFACGTCGKTVHRDPSRVVGGVYCDRACAAEMERRRVVPIADRMWPRVDRGDDCWRWRGPVDAGGYGKISAGSSGSCTQTHIVAWEQADGAPVPAGMVILHTCDIPRCVRNDEAGVYWVAGVTLRRWGHLALGTVLDNNRDRMAKGR
jgi:hypothetical protein